MNRFGSAIRAVAAFALVVATVGIVGWAIVKGVEAEPSVVGSLMTAAAAVIGVIVGRFWEKKLDLRQSHREQMMPIYEKLFVRTTQGELPPKIFMSEEWSDDESLSDEERAERADFAFFMEVKRKLVLYGPAAVIREWNEWASTIPDDAELVNASHMLGWEKVLLTIREDLGHNNAGLRSGDLLRLYITDFDESIAPHIENKQR